LTLDDVHERIRDALASLQYLYRIDEDGDYIVSAGSSRLVVVPRELELAGDRIVVGVRALVLHDVPLTSDLYRFVSTKSFEFIFGALSVQEVEGRGRIWFEYNVLGDYLDYEEIELALGLVGATADNLDDEMQRAFGGNRAAD
jgi:hypothetical protein